ncbi:ComEC/Rec2 family competence protein [Fonticella tunisiensis]|uniref:DNA internalization-related competence protein ComEC/Rec2 n=1 Tax=Fonticella tunisiensis TaxID=1096341 RepID=A0A4R7KPC1_9CLOT|nr:ComEC/Rec2 family competence protein [Fonticella tunisiensis]TDT58426.1 DNA internalization-related competence protein ComEC/Rec2 [Fonticella tunisiensis]
MKRLRLFIVLLFVTLITSCAPLARNINKDENTNLIVSVIDVGQGDSILIKTPKNKYVLVDGGSKTEKDKLFNFLKTQDIDKIDVIIGTHPHEDHIGNLDDVIRDYDVGEIYLPKVTASTKTFADLMDAIRDKNLSIKNAKAGVSFSLDGVNFDFIAPNSSKYEEVNNYSAVVKVTYRKSSFLLMGDAEKLSENEIMSRGFNVSADIIKIGHHGSSSSSSRKFIEAVNPEYAVISCGKGNDYGHPHRETLKLLSDLKIKTYRTDIDGTVSFSTDGYNIKSAKK